VRQLGREMRIDHEYMLPHRSYGLEVDHRDPDEPELDQEVLDEFLANPEAFVAQTNPAIGSLEDLNASLCYVGNTAPELRLAVRFGDVCQKVKLI
jgi:hypothetical protein